jgi:hypothetical protein
VQGPLHPLRQSHSHGHYISMIALSIRWLTLLLVGTDLITMLNMKPA